MPAKSDRHSFIFLKLMHDEKIFNLSALRAGLFKAGYSAREINATMASYAKRGLMKPTTDPGTDGEYIFSKKAYEL